ncbi:bifunctional DNA primase/polymerase [Streptomyces sp. NPDC006602]|uniref:bifunctional DNA primase/polymerase n=1 Tax=Streptomyces sp. NPDC006602 TaxID=3364751 RepID=UPI0036C447AC
MNSVTRKAMEWLAAAATDPRACKRQWRGGTGIAVLACGRLWDVLSVPEELGMPVLDTLLCIPQPPGPALADTAARRVAFFLPPDPDGRWIGSGIRYAGRGSWIAVPAPHRPGERLRWLVPPDGTGALFATAAVELALQVAIGRMAAQAGTRRPCPTCATPTRESALHNNGRTH